MDLPWSYHGAGPWAGGRLTNDDWILGPASGTEGGPYYFKVWKPDAGILDVPINLAGFGLVNGFNLYSIAMANDGVIVGHAFGFVDPFDPDRAKTIWGTHATPASDFGNNVNWWVEVPWFAAGPVGEDRQAYGINDRHDIVGTTAESPGGGTNPRPFAYVGGQFYDLPGGTYPEAAWLINNANADDGLSDPTILGEKMWIKTPTGWMAKEMPGVPVALNDRLEIVGDFLTADGARTYYRNGQWLDLSSRRLSGGAWKFITPDVIYSPADINNHGAIVGRAYRKDDPDQVEKPVLLAQVEITFEPVGDNEPITDNKNSATGEWMPGRGKRVFPDRKTPTDQNPRNKVKVKVKTAPGTAQHLYLKAFDVDDPTPGGANTSDPTHLIDDNDSDQVSHGDDNLSRDSLGFQFPGVFAASQDASITVKVGTDGLATLENGGDIEFIVGMQPGDNYRIAVAFKQDDLNVLHIHGNNQTGCIKPNDEQPSGFNGVVSPMLTVWRHLWLEFDSMGPPPQSGAEKNFDEGAIESIVSNGSQSTLHLNISLTDEADRYQDGLIFLADIGSFTVLSNTDINVFDDDDVVVQGNPGADAVGKTFQIFDDDIVPIYPNNMSFGQPRNLPYQLSGGALIFTAYADAYIEPVNAPNEYIDTNVPFKRNLSGIIEWNTVVGSNKDLTGAADFWLAYLLAAWQGAVSEDLDPSTGAALGTKGESVDINDRGAIYVETLRESELRAERPRIEEEHTIVHEIGHQGGGEHSDGGIMVSGGPSTFYIPPPSRPNDKFEAITIRRFRVEPTF